MSPLEQRESRGKRRGRVEERLGGREPGWRRGGNEERGQASKSRNQETPGKGSEGLQQVQGGNLGGSVGCGGVCVYV